MKTGMLLIFALLRTMFFGLMPGIVDTTTFADDAKIIYGALQNQVSSKAVIMNLFGDGSKFGKPINEIGILGYKFLARLQPNWRLGFRPEGTTGVGTAGNQGLKNATVLLKYAYVPVTITGQAENLTKGDGKAFMQAKALEAKFDMEDIISHLNVIVAGCQRGGELARVTAPAAGSFTASNAGNLPGAIYLRVGMPIDTNAVGGGALTLSSAVITAINYATRLVTVPGTALNGEAVTLGGEAALTVGTFPATMECLLSLVSDTGSIQGLDPSVAGQQSWASYVEDMAAGTIAPQSIMRLLQMVKNSGGADPDMILTSSAQTNQYVGIATTTLRYDVVSSAGGVGKKALDLGFTVFDFAGKPMIEDKDMLPDRLYAGASSTMKKFEAVPLSMADDQAGQWTRLTGASGIADAIGGLLRWYLNIGTLQRSAWGVQTNYAVPAKFLTTPPTR
jgi:hypothetical protein